MQEERAQAILKWGETVQEFLGFTFGFNQFFVVANGTREFETELKVLRGLFFPAGNGVLCGQAIEGGVAFYGIKDGGILRQEVSGFCF